MADTTKIDIGPCDITFATNDLGQTNGDLTFTLDVNTFEITTEQEGLVDEVLNDSMSEVTIPLAYTDKQTLNNVLPWTTLVEDGTSGDTKLEIPKSVQQKMSEVADELVIHPKAKGDSDLSADINILNCYPLPGPIEFTYNREGQRIANITFKALEEESSGNMVVIGDQSITA